MEKICAQRVQRVLMAIMLGVVMGFAGSGMMAVAFVLQLFIMIMLVIWAVTNFCPSIWMLEKAIGKCDFKKSNNGQN